MRQNGMESIPVENGSTFAYLLNIDSAFGDWRAFATEWLITETGNHKIQKAALKKFFLNYLHDMKLDKSPQALLADDFDAPSLWNTLNSNPMSQRRK